MPTNPSFTHTLLQWFEENKRPLPWRNIDDPYKIWVSEIILQQTRVVQGMAFYTNFLQHFPTIQSLASAQESEVLKVWQGLGYYSRARNMHTAAKYVVEQLAGIFPSDYYEIKKMKGVGDYTAAAIASIAFGLPYPAVDGNVLRFISRYYGIFDDISKSATRHHIMNICNTLIDPESPGNFNQAMMEMGALQCIPVHPNCDRCPFATTCYANIHQQVEQLPIKGKHIITKQRFFHYLIFTDNRCTILQKRVHNDIWKNLFEFPLVETTDDHFDFSQKLKEMNSSYFLTYQKIWEVKHQLTHQQILASFYLIRCSKLPQLTENQEIVDLQKLTDYPVSKITAIAIEKIFKYGSTIDFA